MAIEIDYIEDSQEDTANLVSIMDFGVANFAKALEYSNCPEVVHMIGIED